jgi:hypothetical protein
MLVPWTIVTKTLMQQSWERTKWRKWRHGLITLSKNDMGHHYVIPRLTRKTSTCAIALPLFFMSCF